ncbi:hypothetical protein BV20DRAFT_945797 [Pilatotrama ljubarskyi]|nr:hypothetical protein BV20DRAFT_945797 [Pilatotrama ljubarskyi]
MIDFWMGWEAWLAARGFTLSLGEGSPEEHLDKDWCTPAFTAPACLPYAYCIRTEAKSWHPLFSRPATKIGWAQDSRYRDIVFKLTNTDSEEYQIYQHLLHLAEPSDYHGCSGVLRPVAILDTPYNFSFVAMPKWGTICSLTRLTSVAEVVQFLRCTSKDIHQSNMLINCYTPDTHVADDIGKVLAKFRTTEDVHYNLFDFNISLRLPMDTSLKKCRRPAHEASWGSPIYHPPDVALGECEYNPFAFDVACLGNLYRVYFSSAVPAMPLLAPLFDRMTTHVISERFTAPEAADFIDFILAQVSQATLDKSLTVYPEWECGADTDIYWSRTTPEFSARWKQYRTPKRSWFVGVLDRITDLPIAWRLLCSIRYKLRI